MGTRGTAPVLAVLDIGTNSLKLLVGTSDGTRVHTRHFARITTRLGEGLLGSGRISGEAAARTSRALRTLASQARRHGAQSIQGVATYALRTADNGREVARRIAHESGVDVRVLTGREEAMLAYLSARSRLRRRYPATFMLDVGGGSAQFVAVRGTRIAGSHSLALGALRLTERHLHHDPITPGEYDALNHDVARTVRRATDRYAPLASHAALVLVGGSATTALAMSRRGRGHDGDGVLRIGTLRGLERECLRRTTAQRARLPGLPADRAAIMPAGIAVLLHFMEATHRRVAHVTGGGVREGVLLTMAGRESGRSPR